MAKLNENSPDKILMAWNPNIYNKFKSERFLPFYDLATLIDKKVGMSVIDLGCGTGELTRKLADLLPDSNVLGIDSSKEMLNDAREFEREGIRFEVKSIEDQLDSGMEWDLVFSNAAIQWVEDHESLLPKIISTIKPDGTLAVQLPAQHHNITNKMLVKLADELPFEPLFKSWKRADTVLEIDNYAQIIFDNGGRNITVFEKIYPLVLQDSDSLFDWVSGTALIPYLERLEDKNKQNFIDEFKKRLSSKFPKSPVFFPFKRILMKATF